MKNYRDHYRTTQMNPMMFRNYFYNRKNRNNVTSDSGVPGNSISNSNNEMMERKRTYDSEGPPTKRSALIHLDAGFTWNLQALTKAAEAVAQGGKSPVSALNELGVRVVYNLLDHRGPAHCPNFTVAVTVADMTFEGYGSSKRDARANAARTCLNALLMKVGQTPLPVKMNIDFSSDFQCITGRKSPKPKKPGKSEKSEKTEESENSEKSEENTDISEKPENSEKPVAKEKPKAPIVPPEPSPQEPSLFSPKPCIPSHKSPINKLYEMYPTIEFATTYGDGSTLDVDRTTLNLNHSMRFKVVCRLNGMTYEGYGSSKKQAKLAASKAALASIMSSSPPEPVVDSITANSSSGIPQPLADHISKLVNEKFTELMQNDPVHLKRKVLAGIVITIDNELEGAKIIAVTTGTKCVSGDKMSVSGRAVNDCHAEVAARRCLQRYLYKQLLMYADSPRPRVPIESSDIEPIPLAHAGYRLKANRQIHLYISTAPCGDGRIFSPHEEQLEPDRHPNRFSRGQLRTKIESGEGTIPVKNASLIQTWDGVLQGERLLTMSCSDKLARWCVAGLQGALLAQLLQPVYLTSVVLGSLLQRDHMYRAICGRYEAHLQALPPPHGLHAPHLVRAASTEARTPAKAPSFSACWCVTSPKPEIINAITGKLENDQPSLLCKQAMFARWLYLVRKLPVLPQMNQYDSEPLYLEDPGGLLYAEAKELATSYQMAKNCLMKAFRQAQLGTWVKKPIEQDQFYCEIVNANTSLLFA